MLDHLSKLETLAYLDDLYQNHVLGEILENVQSRDPVQRVAASQVLLKQILNYKVKGGALPQKIIEREIMKRFCKFFVHVLAEKFAPYLDEHAAKMVAALRE